MECFLFHEHILTIRCYYADTTCGIPALPGAAQHIPQKWLDRTYLAVAKPGPFQTAVYLETDNRPVPVYSFM